jgi:acetyltransferase-like isoleucine patch superfamily enzyme
MRLVFSVFLGILPSFLKVILLRLAGHQIGKGVKIGFSIINVRNISLADGVKIGNFNIFKGLQYLEIGSGSSIGRFNVFTCSAFYLDAGRGDTSVGRFILGRFSAITMAHYFDVQAQIEIGDDSLVAGLGTIFFTHQKGPDELNQTKPIFVGNRSYLGAACRVMPGTTLANHTIVGAGSVLAGRCEDEFRLYLASKAVPASNIDGNHPYMVAERPAMYPKYWKR